MSAWSFQYIRLVKKSARGNGIAGSVPYLQTKRILCCPWSVISTVAGKKKKKRYCRPRYTTVMGKYLTISEKGYYINHWIKTKLQMRITSSASLPLAGFCKAFKKYKDNWNSMSTLWNSSCNCIKYKNKFISLKLKEKEKKANFSSQINWMEIERGSRI